MKTTRLLVNVSSLVLGQHLAHAFVGHCAGSISQREVHTTLRALPTTQAADELVGLLVNKSSSTPENDRIEDMVQQLVEAQTSFDPDKCLTGPVYVSHIISGPTPLWEKLGIGRKNIQGQQYDNLSRSVINYAEVFGNAIHVRAYGTYERNENETSPKSLSSREPSTTLQCPADFTISVNAACLSVLGKKIQIPIAGEGYLRVLYADPRLRIFVSPKSTTDDRWEKEGLMVDLIDSTFERLD